MNKYYIITLSLCAAVIGGTFVSNLSYAFPNFGNFGSSTVQVQTDSNSGGNSVNADNGSDANDNTVSSGNSNSETTVCTLQNSNGNPNCLQPTTQPTPMPTITPVPGNGGCTDNCGGSSPSPSTNSSSGSSNSQTQAVLGASTMAGTGVFEKNVMNSMFALGVSALILGGFSLTRKKS